VVSRAHMPLVKGCGHVRWLIECANLSLSGNFSSSTALNGGHYAFKGQHAVSLERSTASKPCEETSS
jgi:hypothetical protein